MKKFKIFVCLFSLALFVMAGLGCQQSGAGVEALRGAIKKTDNGELVFTASGKTYAVESQQDLNAMIGKFVKVTGAVSEKDGKLTIAVNSVNAE